jgi:hypothetical protein
MMGKKARKKVIRELRWLAAARAEYCHIDHDSVQAYLDASQTQKYIHHEHTSAEMLANILAGTNDGMGWLPSWRWDEWADIRDEKEAPR